MLFSVENLSIRSNAVAGCDNDLDGWRHALAAGFPMQAGADAASPVPAMIRRRLSPLGRLALGALCDLSPHPEEPAVYASSWGDLSRSWTLLESLSSTGEMSPAAFALSVHNAIGATAAIWLRDHQPFKAVCAGRLTATAGFIECALALESAPSVLLVRYEPVMPEAWRGPEIDECTDFPVAWAMRLVRPGAQGLFDLEITALDKNPQALTRTSSGGAILDEIRFLTGLTTRHVEFEGIPAAAAGDCMTNAARGSLWRRI